MPCPWLFVNVSWENQECKKWTCTTLVVVVCHKYLVNEKDNPTYNFIGVTLNLHMMSVDIPFCRMNIIMPANLVTGAANEMGAPSQLRGVCNSKGHQEDYETSMGSQTEGKCKEHPKER